MPAMFLVELEIRDQQLCQTAVQASSNEDSNRERLATLETIPKLLFDTVTTMYDSFFLAKKHRLHVLQPDCFAKDGARASILFKIRDQPCQKPR